MTTKEEAIQHWQELQNKYKRVTEIRTVWTGDGQGAAASNFNHPKDGYIWVRDSANRPYPVLNRGRVAPVVNVPVFTGYTDIEPTTEQVLDVDYDSMIYGAGGGSTIYSVGAHHLQHEWFGGDEVFIDSRQILPGLVTPTTPASMIVNIKAFTYYTDMWYSYAGGASADFTQYIPSHVDRAMGIVIAFNTNNHTLEYIIGEEVVTGSTTWDQLLDPQAGVQLFSVIPPHAPHQKPLGALVLTDETTVINWTSVVDNIVDLRWSFTDEEADIAELSDGLEEVQLRTGFDPNLATTGAATSRASSYRANAGQIQSVNIASAGPTNNQVLSYDDTQNSWKPRTIPAVPLVVSTILSFPSLRGLWVPGATYDDGADIFLQNLAGGQVAGQNLTLTGVPKLQLQDGGRPFIAFSGTGQWGSSADAAMWDIIGDETYIQSDFRGLTIGAWVWFDNVASTNEYILSKRYVATEESYYLYRGSGGFANFGVTGDGTTNINATSTDTLGASQWVFMCGRFDPSTEVKLWLNDHTYTNVTSVPATIHSGTADLFIGGRDDTVTPGQQLADASISMFWICGAALSDNAITDLYDMSKEIYTNLWTP